MADPEVLHRLDRIEARLGNIEQALSLLVGEESELGSCAACGSPNLQDTTCMGEEPRVTCRDCGETADRRQEDIADG